MSLIGSTHNLKQTHPAELVADLYSEVFDLHPSGGEVDVALAFEVVDPKENDRGGDFSTIRITDFLVVRVSDGEGNNRFLYNDAADPIDLARQVSDWAKSKGTRWLWMHKHPEGVGPGERVGRAARTRRVDGAACSPC